jgi:sugar lactone lactonase YvrE
VLRLLLAAAGVLPFAAAVPRVAGYPIGTFKIEFGKGPLIAQSRVAVSVSGITQPYTLSLLGSGRLAGAVFIAPPVQHPTTVTLIGAARGLEARSRTSIVPAPAAARPLLAVATYRDGIALHDPGTFRLLGYLGIGGAPGDALFENDGSIVSANTDGTTLTRITRSPWHLQRVAGVAVTNELAIDRRTGDIFATDRDIGGFGALTRVTPGGMVTRVRTGDTAEGLALDVRSDRAYVGNVNDATVAVVSLSSMRVLRKLRSVPRTFGIALDRSDHRLFVVSNASTSMQRGGGYVAAIDLAAKTPHVTIRSAPMTFPLGIAYDRARNRVFVTDEAANVVYVLDARTLRAAHSALRTCRTPWRPSIASGRLYIPCAQSDRVDVFSTATLRRISGAPFATGGFPLSVARWH